MTITNLLGEMKNQDGLVVYRAVLDQERGNSHSLTFTVWEITSWESDDEPTDNGIEVATFFVKWDGCSHVGFRDPSLGSNWVHVCGVKHMVATLDMLKWAWNLAATTLVSRGFPAKNLGPIP